MILSKVKNVALNLFGWILGIIFIFPVYFSLVSAFKTNGEILRSPLALPSELQFNNFVYLWKETKFTVAFVNSTLITVISLAIIVFVVPMASYPIARKKSSLYHYLYLYFIASMMIPFQTYMIPLFQQMKKIGLIGTIFGPIAINAAMFCGLGVLMYASFIKGIPSQIEEAALIDGCNQYQTFWRIIFPLLKPCTSSVIVLAGLAIWNDFLMPLLVMTGMETKTVNVEIFSFVDQFASRWDILFAGTVVAMMPVLILFMFSQQYFIKGITAGSSK